MSRHRCQKRRVSRAYSNNREGSRGFGSVGARRMRGLGTHVGEAFVGVDCGYLAGRFAPLSWPESRLME